MKSLDSVPVFQFHCLFPDKFRALKNSLDLPREYKHLISEFVCDQLCKVDKEFASEYLDRLFNPNPKLYHPQYTRQPSGRIHVYSVEYMTYYCSPEKSWKRIPPVKKLQFWKEIKDICK